MLLQLGNKSQPPKPQTLKTQLLNASTPFNKPLMACTSFICVHIDCDFTNPYTASIPPSQSKIGFSTFVNSLLQSFHLMNKSSYCPNDSMTSD